MAEARREEDRKSLGKIKKKKKKGERERERERERGPGFFLGEVHSRKDR